MGVFVESDLVKQVCDNHLFWGKIYNILGMCIYWRYGDGRKKD